MRLRTLVTALVGAGVCTSAAADPITVSAFLVNAAFALKTISVVQFIVASAAVIGAGVMRGKQQAKKAAAAARAAFNASLQDRQISFKSAIAPRPIIYGRQLVGGAIVFATTTGARSEFLHLVVAISGRQIDAIEQVWFGDEVLPTPDANGFIQSGPFSDPNPVSELGTGSSTSFTVAFPPTSVQSVSRERATLDPPVQPAGFSFAGNTITITDGLHQAGDQYTVNYTRTLISPRVRVRLYTGAPGQVADPDLIAETGGQWTSAHVGNGIAYAYIRLEYDQDVFGQTGLPEIRFLVRGFRCFDPRTSTTVWTQNAALCTADYLRDGDLGMGAAAGEVPAAELIAAANVCDEEVALYSTGTMSVAASGTTVTGTGTAWLARARQGMLFRVGGTVATIQSVASDTSLTLTAPWTGTAGAGQSYSLRQLRYQTNGVLSSEAQPPDNLEELAGAMAGSVVWVQGRWLVRAGAGRLPEFTLTESDLAGSEIVVQPRASRSNLFNAVTGTFSDRAQRYAESQYPAVSNAAYQAQDGGARITRQIQFAMTDDATACQRLAKIALERARQAMVVKLTTNLRAYDLVPTDWVALTLSRYGWVGKNFEVIERVWNGAQLEYTLRETAAAVYDWALGEQTAVDLAPNTNLPNPFGPIPALTGLAVASGTAQLRVLNDGTIITQGLVTWTQSTDVFTLRGGRIEIEWKLDNEVNWQAAPPEPGDATTAIIGPLDDRRITLVRVRPVNSLGRTGAWTTIAHTVVGKSAAPSNVTGLTASVIAGAVRLNWARCPDGDYQTTELRRGASWAAGVRLDTGAAGSLDITGTGYDWSWPAIGSYTILARHRDTSGNLSTATASLAITVTSAGISIGASGISAQIGGGNVLRNSGALVDSNADGIADSWGIFQTGSTGTVTVSRDTTGGPDNGPYQRVSASALAASGAFIGVSNGADRRIALPDAGGPVTISAFVRISGSGALPVEFFVEFKNAAGSVIGFTRPSFSGLSTPWTRITHTAQAPAGTRSVFFYCWLSGGAGASAFIDVTHCQVEPGDVATAYAPRADELLPGVVGTTELGANAATDVIAQNDLGGGLFATSTPNAVFSGSDNSFGYTNTTGGAVDVELSMYINFAGPSGTGSITQGVVRLRAVGSTIGTNEWEHSVIPATPVSITGTLISVPAGESLTISTFFQGTAGPSGGGITYGAIYTRATEVRR